MSDHLLVIHSQLNLYFGLSDLYRRQSHIAGEVYLPLSSRLQHRKLAEHTRRDEYLDT